MLGIELCPLEKKQVLLTAKPSLCSIYIVVVVVVVVVTKIVSLTKPKSSLVQVSRLASNLCEVSCLSSTSYCRDYSYTLCLAFTWVLGIWIQVSMFAWQSFY